MQHQRFWRAVGVGLVAVVASPGALIAFLNRADFAANTTLATGLPNANGVDFTSAAVCPTTAVSGTTGCAPVAPANAGVLTYSSTGTGATGAVLSFASIPNFTIQGFSLSSSSGATRLSLYAVGYDHAAWLPMTYSAPVLSTRNTSDANAGNLRIRVNLPANVDSFAIDLSNGCNTNTNQSGINNCTPEENHLGTILVTAKRVGIVPTETALVTTTNPTGGADFTFFGVRSDAGDLEYVEFTLPTFADAPTNSIANVGAIMASRIAFGEAQTPEPATFLLTAAGLALLLRRRTR